MYLLSKLIAFEWFKSLFKTVIVLFLLISVGDIINGFVLNYSLRRIFLEYLLKLPDLAGKMIPVCALLASLFSITKLKAHGELMGVLAGGYSVDKIYRLVAMCSLTMALLQLLNLGFLLPMANKVKRVEFEKSQKSESKYLARSRIGGTGLIWYKTENYFTSFKAFDPKNKILKDVTVYFLSKDKKLDSIYQADSAQFVSDNKWNLKGIKVVQNLKDASFPKSLTAKNLFINLKENPSDFGEFEADITTLDIFELGTFIARLQATDINSSEYEIMYLEKFALAFICIVFALFPISGIFSPNRRSSGFGKSIVITLVFSIFFWGVHASTISLGNNGKLPIFIATFGIPALFTAYIIGLFYKNRSL